MIDPTDLTTAQRTGERCIYSNCRRWLPDLKTFFGSLPDGSPVFACPDHEEAEQ